MSHETGGPSEDEVRFGDKVRLKVGMGRKHAHGIVTHISGAMLTVRLDSGDTRAVDQRDVSNLSRAARRAWKARPGRAVGRPRSPETAKKKAVTIRMDVEVWARLGRAMEQGLIPSREQAVNVWVRERVDVLLDASPPTADATKLSS